MLTISFFGFILILMIWFIVRKLVKPILGDSVAVIGDGIATIKNESANMLEESYADMAKESFKRKADLEKMKKEYSAPDEIKSFKELHEWLSK